MIGRRHLLMGGGAVALSACVSLDAGHAQMLDLADLEARLGPGGRLGVAARDSGTGAMIGFNADQRFAFCSTFKLLLAAAILAEADAGRLRLDQQISFGRDDLVPHAPVTEANLGHGSLSVERLCVAIVEVSDNPAANLLMKKIGGPAGMTRYFRSLGDPVSRLDRWETDLNQNLAGDPRDTTTAAAMVGSTLAALTSRRLSTQSRARISQWLVSASTGLDRLRAGLPGGWRAGDKTGTGARGSNNDVAIAWPPGRPPIVIASYTSEGTADNAERNAVHAEVGRRVAAAFA